MFEACGKVGVGNKATDLELSRSNILAGEAGQGSFLKSGLETNKATLSQNGADKLWLIRLFNIFSTRI